MLCITPRYTYAEIIKSQRTSYPQAIYFRFKKNHLAFGIWNILCKYVVPDTEGIKTCTFNVFEVV